jgi:DNA-binding NtrC family response regulator
VPRFERASSSAARPLAISSGVAPPQDFSGLLEAARRQLQTQRPFNLDDTLQQWERGYVEAALAITQGNLTRAAKLLGIHRTTLYSRMQNYANPGETAKITESK